MRSILLFTFITLFIISCGGKEYKYDQENTILDVSKKEQSSSAGNLMASAIKEAHDLDIVLYPKKIGEIFRTIETTISSYYYSETVKSGVIVKRNGLLYKKYTDIPFTGKVNGRWKGEVRNGNRNGL